MTDFNFLYTVYSFHIKKGFKQIGQNSWSWIHWYLLYTFFVLFSLILKISQKQTNQNIASTSRKCSMPWICKPGKCCPLQKCAVNLFPELKEAEVES